MKNVGKKKLSVIITIILLFSTVFCSYAENVESNLIDFNFDESAQPDNLWGFSSAGTNFQVLQTTDPTNAENKVIQFKGGNTEANSGIAKLSLPTLNDISNINIEFDIYQPKTSSGDTFLRVMGSNNKDIFSLYLRESGDATNVVGKSMRCGLNTFLTANNSFQENAQSSSKYTTTPNTYTVGENGKWYHVSSNINISDKKQDLIISEKSTGNKIIEKYNEDILYAQDVSYIAVGYGWIQDANYPGTYMDNLKISATMPDDPILISSFASNGFGNISAKLYNISQKEKIDANIYSVAYDNNGKLSALNVDKVSINNGIDNGIDFKTKLNLGSNANNIKLFVWNDQLQPLSQIKNTIDEGYDYNMFDMIQPVPLKNQLKDDGYFVWCGSYIKVGDKYHVYYSRWEKKYGFVTGWVSNSEIAHAVSDNIDGPYVFQDVVLTSRDRSYWDGTTAHNPYILEFNGKYYLYYMGTTAPEGLTDYPVPYTSDWWQYRNRQQIGVAVSDSPYGPWERYDTPVIAPSEDDSKFDSLAVTNPAVTKTKDGKILMLYKGIQDTTNGDLTNKNGPVMTGVALADDPKGPFTKTYTLAFTDPENPDSKEWLSEDPFVWYSAPEDKYKAIGRDLTGKFTGVAYGLVMLESKDGINNWVPTKNCCVLKNRFMWEGGVESQSHIERPWVMFDDKGLPTMFFGATRLQTDESDTTNVFIPLK